MLCSRACFCPTCRGHENLDNLKLSTSAGPPSQRDAHVGPHVCPTLRGGSCDQAASRLRAARMCQRRRPRAACDPPAPSTEGLAPSNWKTATRHGPDEVLPSRSFHAHLADLSSERPHTGASLQPSGPGPQHFQELPADHRSDSEARGLQCIDPRLFPPLPTQFCPSCRSSGPSIWTPPPTEC
jgi:hypothetical protein